MTQVHQIPVLIPLAVGSIAVVLTILTHSVVLNLSINFIRRQKSLGRTGSGFWIDVTIVGLAVSFWLVAHLTEIGWWALLFVFCGEFPAFGSAYYHSAVNYTTLGYGDVILSDSWKVLGPLEAANGALMFGVSTALLFALIQRLIQKRFMDLYSDGGW